MAGMEPHKSARLTFQPRIRKGAFFDAAWRHGCRNFSVYNRTYISGCFSDPVDEYWQVVDHAALWPVMGERQVEITGPDAARFVQFLTPRDMTKCAVGQCKYALITAEDGGVICDPIILRPDPDRFWLSTSDCDLELWAKGVAVHASFDAGIRDVGVSVIQVQGPKSAQVMAELFGDTVLDLGYYRLTRVPFEATELVVSRTGWSGELGYELYLHDASLGDALFEALMAAGAPFNLRPGAVSQIRRIESGILSWGIDMTPSENPFEVGLGRLVDLDDTPEFIGKEALRSLSAKQPRRQLVGLTIAGAPLEPNEDIWPILAGGAQAGKLTSLAYSPRLERNIALAIVDSGHATIGTELTVAAWDGARSAIVSELPFMPKRQSHNPRQPQSAS